MGAESLSADMPASCFATATPGDITFQGRKFVGSAQKRFGPSLLQHGSILLRSQEELLTGIFAGEGKTGTRALLEKMTCLDDILNRRVETDELSEVLVSGFRTALNVDFQPDGLSCEEETLAASLTGKYGMLCKQQK
jgi:lipoate-protein ligase A